MTHQSTNASPPGGMCAYLDEYKDWRREEEEGDEDAGGQAVHHENEPRRKLLFIFVLSSYLPMLTPNAADKGHPLGLRKLREGHGLRQT